MPRTAMLVTPTTQEQARRWPALLASALWVLTLLALPMVNWLDQLLRQAGLPELAILEPAAFPLIAAAVTAATVGAVLASYLTGFSKSGTVVMVACNGGVDLPPSGTGGPDVPEPAGRPRQPSPACWRSLARPAW